jgi:hypothetical protein
VVRQPAEPVLTAGGVHFESRDDTGPSKFHTYADDFRALDESLQGNPEYEGVLHVPVTASEDEIERSRGAAGAGSGGGEARAARRATERDAAEANK